MLHEHNIVKKNAEKFASSALLYPVTHCPARSESVLYCVTGLNSVICVVFGRLPGGD